MTSERFTRVRKLVLAVVKLPAARRRAYLDDACAGDARLLAEVESLLTHDTDGEAILEIGGALPFVPVTDSVPDPGVSAAEQTTAPGPLTGETISHFHLGNLIGRGGVGDVYRAEDTKLQREVAIKVLSPLRLDNPVLEQRFKNEARAISALDHQNIGGVHEFVSTVRGLRLIVMPLYTGGSVKDRIAAGPLACNQALDLAVQIASGLRAAHEAGILHRDLKPGNVMLTAEGTARLIDFGLAKLAEQDSLTRTGTSLGTVAYMSPELIQGQPFDERSDVFSLGVTLQEMLTGRLPFEGDSTAALLIGITRQEPRRLDDTLIETPAGLQSILDRALAKDPDHRYQCVADLLNDLRLVRDGADLNGLIADRPTSPRRSRARRSWTLGLVAAVCAVLAVLISVSWFSGAEAPAMLTAGSGRSYLVLPDGSGDHATIGQAVAAAAGGDTILLGDGVFIGDGNRDLDLGAKSLVVRSVSNDPIACTIDCGGSAQEPHRGFRIESGQRAQVLIQGLTVTNGWQDDGGAVHVYASNPVIDSCRFIDNTSNDGGGIYAEEGSVPIITDCYFAGNQATSGAGALYFQHSPGILSDSVFHHNFAFWAGGAIHNSHCAPRIDNCLFVDNNGRRWGNAMSFIGPDAVGIVTNCTFVGRIGVRSQVHCSYDSAPTIGNSLFALDGPTVAVFCNEGGPPILENCNVYNYQGDSWAGCIADQLGARGNIDAAPLFCSLADRRFTIQSESPCSPDNTIAGELIGGFGVGCGGGDCIDVPADQATIAAALAAAAVGDTVRIATGTWFEADLELPAGVTLLGATGDPADVIIDARRHGRVLRCDSLAVGVRIEGVTITGGRAVGDHPANRGGGIACFATGIIIDNCVVTNNTAYDGGGVYLEGDRSVQIMRSEFTGNLAQYKGGGVSCRQSADPVITDCVFEGNRARIDGGGMYLRQTRAHVASCSFFGNSSDRGSTAVSELSTTDFSYCLFVGNQMPVNGDAVGATVHFLSDTRGWVLNCTFTGNAAGADNGAISIRAGNLTVIGTIIHGNTSGCAISTSYRGTVSLSGSDLFGNQDGDYVGCVADQRGVDGNTSLDPRFVDPSAGDYRLREDSPCVAGANRGYGQVGAYTTVSGR